MVRYLPPAWYSVIVDIFITITGILFVSFFFRFFINFPKAFEILLHNKRFYELIMTLVAFEILILRSNLLWVRGKKKNRNIRQAFTIWNGRYSINFLLPSKCCLFLLYDYYIRNNFFSLQVNDKYNRIIMVLFILCLCHMFIVLNYILQACHSI